MNRLAATLVVLLAMAYQVLATPLYAIGPAVPDFVLLVLVYLAFFAQRGEVVALALAWSVIADLMSLDPLGTTAFGLVPVLLLVGRMRGWFVLEAPLLRPVIVLAAAFLCARLARLYAALAGGPAASGGDGIESFLGAGLGADAAAAVYTALAGVLVHGLLDLHRGRLGWRRDRHFSRAG